MVTTVDIVIVGIISDTHDRLPLIDEAVKRLNEICGNQTIEKAVDSSRTAFILTVFAALADYVSSYPSNN